MLGMSETSKQDILRQLTVHVIYGKKQLRHAQAWYKLHFNARLFCSVIILLLRNMFFAETTLADQPHKLASSASSLFSIVVVDLHTVTRQRANGLFGNVFVIALLKQWDQVQVLFQKFRMLLLTVLVFWIYPLVVILAILLVKATLLPRAALKACPQILLLHHRRTVSTIVEAKQLKSKAHISSGIGL